MAVDAPERSTELPGPGTQDWFPADREFDRLLQRRTRKAQASQLAFLSALIIAVLALATLLYSIINDAFGLVAIVNENNPEDVVAEAGYDPATVNLEDLTKDQLVTLLEGAVSTNVGRRLEREQRFYDDRYVFEDQAVYEELCASDPVEGCSRGARSKADVFDLVLERVVVPDVIAAEELVPSILAPGAFEEEIVQAFVDSPERFPDYTADQVRFEWRSWVSTAFIRSSASATPEVAGIRTAALGTLWIAAITILFAVPVGVGAAIYLVEFAKPSRFNDFIQTNINNLAGVPSIIYGMLGLAVLVRTFEPVTSGDVFTSGNPPSENGRTVLSAGITLGLLVLPIIIISAQEALKAVPNSLRQAGMGLGATKWQTVRSQVLPVALPGILTGVILSVARAIGETAPLIVVGAASFITADPTGPFSKYTAMPIQIFQWTSLPQAEWRHLAAAAIIVLLVILLVLNATAVILRNRYSTRA